MKLLKDLLYKAPITEVRGSTNVAITSVTFDSRTVNKDSLFVAVRGTRTDGHAFITEVISKGAAAIVCEDYPAEMPEHVAFIKVKDASHALGIIAANFYDNPSGKLKLVGVTGTNGKTTTATLLYQLFRSMGHRSGLLSTVSNRINSTVIPATHTTPDAISLNALLAQMVEKGCTHCFMEVSSHAVIQQRISGLLFTGGIFTNITHDHLDYHKTFDEYIRAKKSFFDQLPSSAFALVNKDDANGEVMLQNTRASKYTYSLRSASDFKCKVVENQFAGLLLNLDGTEVWTKLIGYFNAYNLLAVYGAGILLREDKMNVLTSLSTLTPVEGRFQFHRTESGLTGIVDYAHTPDALQNVLKTIHEIRSGNEKVFTVVGCGGDRDPMKRPIMAKIALEHSDQVIFTSDNPRSEDPEAILRDMQKGVAVHQKRKVLVIADRREAIRTACSMAASKDIILVAGKGHETYQEIRGERFPFDDMEILQDTLKMMEK